jgi:hypothetical protein
LGTANFAPASPLKDALPTAAPKKSSEESGETFAVTLRPQFPALLPLASFATPGATISCARAPHAVPHTDNPSHIHFFIKLPTQRPRRTSNQHSLHDSRAPPCSFSFCASRAEPDTSANP